MKLMPGVRLNFSKETVGMSFGVPGMRYTINSKGRRTFSSGIPGTGLYNVETLSSGRTSSRKKAATEEVTQVPVVPPAPGLFARRSEVNFHDFLNDIYNYEHTDSAEDVLRKAAALKERYPDLHYPLRLICFVHAITTEEFKEIAIEWGAELWENRAAAFDHKLSRKYLKGIYPQTRITPGIWTRLSYDEQILGFIWVEVMQDQKRYQEAMDILLEMIPDQLVAVSLADLEISIKNYDGAIETTEDIENVDDATAMLLILRGIAFREKNLNDASIECFKRALANKENSEEVKHRALYERAQSLIKTGKKAAARKDLEKILVDDPNHEGANKSLSAMESS
jgi:tetratricopeptide (TPR) repeat protein